MCLASSTDGVSYTKHGAISGSSGVNSDDAELLHDPRTGRTYLYGTSAFAANRNPVVWYTDDADLSTATWTQHGACTDKSTGTWLPYAVWIDASTGIFWMVAGSSGDNTVFYSADGLTYITTTRTVEATLHSFLITDRDGTFWGWGTNDGGGNVFAWYRKVLPRDVCRHVVPLAFSTVSATGSMVFAAARGHTRKISNIKFTVPTAIAADASNYWTFEIRSRTPGGSTVSPTITGTTIAGVSSYDSVSISGTYTISSTACLQAFWTKTGSPANPAFLSVEYTEHA